KSPPHNCAAGFLWSDGGGLFGLALGRGGAQAVDDGDDQPPDAVLGGAVGGDAQGVEPAVNGGDLPVDRGQVFHRRAAGGLNGLARETVGKDLDRTADVVIHQLELPPNILGELADVQIAVHKQNADHGGGQEVGQVVGHHGQL